MKKIKEMFQSKNSRNGVYSAGLVCIVIAIVVVINLIAGQMPDSLKNIDLSDTHIYDISDTSTDMLKDLDKDIQFQSLTAWIPELRLLSKSTPNYPIIFR